MGWGRMLLLGDWGQQMDLEDQKEELHKARLRLNAQTYKDQSQDKQIAQLEADNQNLRLYLFGLIRLLQAKSILSEQEVERLVGGIEKDEER